MASKKTKTYSAKQIAEVCPPIMKDGYGAHWHALSWIIALTVILSTSTMVYAAYSVTVKTEEVRSLETAMQLQAEMQTLNSRLDVLEASINELKGMVMEPGATTTASR